LRLGDVAEIVVRQLVREDADELPVGPPSGGARW
jgi:hypothetical protein